MPLFAIVVETEFCASHQLRLPGGALEPMHGHNFKVAATVESKTLDALETVIDFHIVQESLRKIVEPLSNQHINTIDPFNGRFNPSAERIAQHIGESLARSIPAPAHVARVSVTEAAGCRALWFPDV